MLRLKSTGCLMLLVACVALVGCIKARPATQLKPFEVEELDACLAIVIDMSGSFADQWQDQAHPLFLDLMDQFFTEAQGGNSRVVICQLSGSGDVVLFEGRPDELRSRFRTPDELGQFLQDNSDPAGSQVYQSTNRVLAYVASLPGIGDHTHLMTVILSDLEDSTAYGKQRTKAGNRMLATLKRYQQLGGGLALYCVSPKEQQRWRKICSLAEFEPGSYVIENTLVARPQLPRFD